MSTAPGLNAWHFARDDRRLGHGDGREIIEGGELWVDGEIKLCYAGLHWCRRPIDAINYASGNVICKVEPLGEIFEDNDKGVSQGRKVLWMSDCSEMLTEFERLVALDLIKMSGWSPRPVIKKYLETGDERIRSDAKRCVEQDGWIPKSPAIKAAAAAVKLSATGNSPIMRARRVLWAGGFSPSESVCNKLEEMINKLRKYK